MSGVCARTRVCVYIGRGHREGSLACRAGKLHEGRALFGFSAAQLRLRNDRMRHACALGSSHCVCVQDPGAFKNGCWTMADHLPLPSEGLNCGRSDLFQILPESRKELELWKGATPIDRRLGQSLCRACSGRESVPLTLLLPSDIYWHLRWLSPTRQQGARACTLGFRKGDPAMATYLPAGYGL